MDHAEVMNSCDAKAQRLGFAALTEVERVVVLVNQVHFEIVTGGFSQFYYNDAGNCALETVPALEAVGAFKAATALRKANALFPDGNPSPDREQRYDEWRVLVDARSLRPLDELFNEEDGFDHLCSYIEAHAAQLREHLAR
jgi:hypothetical protein